MVFKLAHAASRQRRSEFDPWPEDVRLVLDKVALRHVFSASTSKYSPLSIIPPKLHLHNTVSERQASDAWEPSKSKYFLWGVGELWAEK